MRAIRVGRQRPATLLTGQPNNGNINNLNNIDYFRHTYSLFAQNDWRVTPKLNLNLGLRYEYFSPVYERFHAQASFSRDWVPRHPS